MHLYKNNGAGNLVSESFTPVSDAGAVAGSAKFVDYDNDGDLDLLIAGASSFSNSATKPPTTYLYANNGGTFSEVETSFLGAFKRNADNAFWTDTDNDGDLDLILTGDAGFGENNENLISQEYINNGKGSFVLGRRFEQNDVLAAADYDLDGKVEFLGASRFYEVGADNDIKIIDLGLNAQNIMWVDFNNDGRLDICEVTSDKTKIYRNLNPTTNVIPTVPLNLRSTPGEATVTLSWNAAFDTETPAQSLSYNIYVGTASEGIQVRTPMAVTSVGSANFGFRKVFKIGNAQLNTQITLNGLATGTYYWSVQAIDQSGGVSFFAQEQTFEIKDKPNSPNTLDIAVNQGIIEVSWEDQSTDEDGFVLLRSSKSISDGYKILDTIPANTGTGTIIYSEDNSNLTNGTTYYYKAYAYNSAGASNLMTNAKGIAAAFSKFSPKYASKLEGFANGTSAAGDLDGDGDIDFIYTGRNNSKSIQYKIYLNNGYGFFNDANHSGLTAVADGTVKLADYDGDGDLDIFIAGSVGSSSISKVYENKGNLSFEELELTLPGYMKCTALWGDYNNDGDLDIWINGKSEEGDLSMSIFYNNRGADGSGSNDQFLTRGTAITGTINGSIDLGDFDNDGDLDVIICGQEEENSASRVTKVYKNDGNGGFTLASTGVALTQLYMGKVKWGDYDNDGDLDILISGDPVEKNTADEITKIYKNNGDGTFQDAATLGDAIGKGDVHWFDYDNDGDLDVIMAGQNSIELIFTVTIYTNNGSDNFVKETNLPDIAGHTLTFADFDNDQDLDFLALEDALTVSKALLIRNEATTPNTAPTPPNNLKATVVKDTVTLQWDKAADTQTDQNGLTYNLRVGSSSNTNNIVASMANQSGVRQVSRRNIQRNMVTFYGLKPGIYHWSVQALDQVYAGSNFATEQTFRVVSQPIIPTIEAFALSSSTILLFWLQESNETNLSNYVIEMSLGNTSNFQPIDTILSTQGSYEVINLSENTTYYFRIFAYNTTGNGQSNIDFDQTNNLPRSPQKLEATTASASQVNLTWVDVATTESGFIIYRKSLLTNDQFEIIDSLKTPNQTNYSDTKGLVGNVTYTYEVRTYNANGVSGEAEDESVTTPIDNGVALPPKPLNFFANPFSPSQISLEWNYTSTAANSFVIERSSQDDSTNYKQIAEIPAQTLRAYNDTVGLVADKIYYYRMRAKNSGGLSDFSDIALAKAECNLPIFVSLAEGQVNQVCVGQGAKIEVTADLFQPTYQWKRNGVKIPNANAQFYVAYQTGEYTCEVSSGSCTQTTKSAVVIVVKDPLTVNISSQNGILIPSVTNAQTYTWYYNLEPIAGANGVNFTPTANGKYYLVIEKDGCSATSNIVDLTAVVGLTESDLSRAITLSPNPASNEVEVNIKALIKHPVDTFC